MCLTLYQLVRVEALHYVSGKETQVTVLSQCLLPPRCIRNAFHGELLDVYIHLLTECRGVGSNNTPTAATVYLVDAARHCMCCSRNYPYPPPKRKDWDFLGEGGSLRPKHSKEGIMLNWNPQRGGGGGQSWEKIPSMGQVWIFLELHIKLHS